MKLNKKLRGSYLIGLVLLGFVSCAQDLHPLQKVRPIVYQNSVDTESRPILLQTKKVYFFERTGIGVHNQFDGARLNNFQMVNDSVFDATISPENSPINPSPWFAFKIWASKSQTVTIKLQYSDGATHRYTPKLSKDGQHWNNIDEQNIIVSADAKTASLRITASPDTLWISAQEIINSTAVKNWCLEKETAFKKYITVESAGTSKLGRQLQFMDINNGKKDNKKVIVILSRQHPPEVTGYFAMQAFVEGLLADARIAKFLEQYRILVFPLLNPDGVDLGHWRHNAGGVDLNRDWSHYHQEEIRQITSKIVAETSNYNSKVILGLDFHSTWDDVYYTNQNTTTHVPRLKDDWLKEIEKNLEGYIINEKPSDPESPVSKAWFYKYFSAEGITYEIGDNTDREFIKEKGKVSATSLLNILGI